MGSPTVSTATLNHIGAAYSSPGLAGAPYRHSVDRALDVLAAGLLAQAAVATHEFGLADYREAIGRAIDRRASHAIKVVFRP